MNKKLIKNYIIGVLVISFILMGIRLTDLEPDKITFEAALNLYGRSILFCIGFTICGIILASIVITAEPWIKTFKKPK